MSCFKPLIQRRNGLAIIWLLAGMMVIPWTAMAEEVKKAPPRIAVVTHIENKTTSITRTELTRMFRKQQTEWPDGQRCIPIDQMGGSDIRAEFGRIVLKESPDEWKRYWIQQTMTGNARPPIALENSETIKKYLQKLPGAVAYVYENEVDDTVRVLTISDAPELATPRDSDQASDPPGETSTPPPSPADGTKNPATTPDAAPEAVAPKK